MKLSAIAKAIVVSSLMVGAMGVANAKTNYKDAVFKDAVVCPALKDGIYLGAQAGYDAFRVHQSYADPDASFSVNGILTGWTGGLFVGYGQYFQNFYYLGAELLGNYNGSNPTLFTWSDNDGDSATQKVKAKATYGIALLPGLRIQESVLGYLRLGYDWTQFEGNYSSVDATDGSTFSSSKSTTQGGFDAGIGMEALVSGNWSVRTEYNHIWYNSANLTGNQPASNNPNTSGASSSNTNLSDNQFNLGIVYHIG